MTTSEPTQRPPGKEAAGATTAVPRTQTGERRAAQSASSGTHPHAKDLDGDTATLFADRERTATSGSRRLAGLPVWAWVLLLMLGAAGVLGALDWHNRNRQRLACDDGRMVLQRGRQLPWPVGYENVGDPFLPLILSPGECREQYFHDLPEAEQAYLEVALQQAHRDVATGASGDLRRARRELQRAMMIAETKGRPSQRRDIAALLADLAYREGREELDRAELALRNALSKLEHARMLAPTRHQDAEPWIEQIRTLLQSIIPAPPASLVPGRSAPLIAPREPMPLPSSRPERSSNPTSDAGEPARDGGIEAQQGVLM